MEFTGRNKRGQVLILLVLMLVMLLAVAGLALDVGMAYVVKTKLSAAVDAAALAAGKVVSAQDGTLETEARKFFSANYPDGLLGSKVESPTTTAAYDNKEKSWTVTVKTTATVPTQFARAVGWDAFTVGATATSTISPVDLVLVMDSSRSLERPVGTLFRLKDAAKNFVSLFNTRNDRVGLIHFSSGAVQDVGITANRGFDPEAINRAINGLTEGGYTTAEEALRLAEQQLDNIPPANRSRLRVIVFLADGAPNGVAGNYETTTGTVKGVLSSETAVLGEMYYVDRKNSLVGYYTVPNLPAVDHSNTVALESFNRIRDFDPPAPAATRHTPCNLNKAARNMVENVANEARSGSGASGDPITIFTIGLGAHMRDLEIACPGYGSNEFGENIMKRVANVRDADTYNPAQPTGVYAFAADASQLDAAFNQVARAILRLSK